TYYEIHLNEINTTAKTIDAFTIVTLLSKVDNLTEIKLELLDLIVDEVFVYNQLVNDFEYIDPWLIIPLSSPVNTGDEVVVKVAYHGEPFHEDWGGFHFSGAYAFNLGVGFDSDPHNLGKAWFPCIDDFHDRAIYEIFVTVDEPKVAVCGGTLLEIINNGNGTQTYRWKLHDDIPTYLASVAIGEYINMPMTFNSLTGEDIPIGLYVRPADTAKVEGTFQTLIPTLEAYENWFGPYLWERVGYVGTAIGAMEHSTNIAFPHFCISGNLNYESLMAHELSHQYFGDGITCASAEDMWINEGWAVFCELLYWEAIYDQQTANEVYREKHKEVVYKAHIDDGGYLALYGIPTEYTYGETVYQKGGIVCHTLRNYIGDEEFFPAVREYVDAYKFNYASSWDLRDILTAHTSLNLDDFFEGWVFSPGFPEFSVDSFAVANSGSSYDVTVFAKQKLKGATSFYNSNRVDVTFMNDEWETETQLMEFSGETGGQTFNIGFEPTLVMMDYYDKCADATSDENVIITETGNKNLGYVYVNLTTNEISPGDSAFVRVTHRWVAPDPLKTPLQGLTLSDYRHWRIDGIFPEGFALSGSFFYSKYNYLDNTLLTNANDSIVILYRPSREADWQSVYFNQTGNANIGYIEVPYLHKGEYTLAVWDEMYVGLNSENKSSENNIEVYPNPANDVVFIHFRMYIPLLIDIYSSNGSLVQEIKNDQKNDSIRWDCSAMPSGTYYIRCIDTDGNPAGSKKIIIK
nr:T9SS type A sorting domain-containing protein [Bacteroidota bacterium]